MTQLIEPNMRGIFRLATPVVISMFSLTLMGVVDTLIVGRLGTEAIAEFEKVLDLNPSDNATHYNLGIIYAEYLNNKPKAILHFKRYLLNASQEDKDTQRAKKYIMTWEKWEEGK